MGGAHIIEIDGQPYSSGLYREKSEGSSDYTVKVRIPREARPAVGDSVKILDTENTRTYFEFDIGQVREITHDCKVGDVQHYQIADNCYWLYESDVQLVEVLHGVQS